MILRLGLVVAVSATAPSPIALPDYASADYSAEAAIAPIMPVCLAAVAEEIQGRSFAAPIERAIQGQSAAVARRVLEVCVTFRLGALVMANSIAAARREAQPQRRPSTERVI